MTKLKCLIVDDEPPAIRIISSYIESIDSLELAGACFNALEARQVLLQKHIDLLFLDIRLPHLLGTEFIRTLQHPPKVIFTTAYKDFALDGFELNAADFLLKPFSLERFIKAINKVTPDTLPAETPAPTEKPPHDEAFLYFRVDRKMIRVELDEITYIESVKDYIKIVRRDQRPLLVKKSITSVEAMLPAHLFLRIHRSFIIAVKKITAYTHNDVEIAGQEIPIGKLYRHQLRNIH